MTGNATIDAIVSAGPYLVFGLAVGAAFFGLMRLNVALYLQGGRTGLAIALNTARLAGAGLAFWWCASTGRPWPVLLALVGFLIARVAVTRMAEKKEA